MTRHSRLTALVFVVIISTSHASGQTVSGSIAGTVKDPGEGVVAGARVQLLNTATGSTRETVSDSTGGFSFQSLQPGSYSVSVEYSGFKHYRQTDIQLTSSERIPLEVRLEIGATTESVNVVAQGTAVQTLSSERSGVVTSAQLSTLLLKGRDFMGLLRTLPGVVDTNSRESPTNNSLTGLSIQGGRQGTYNLTLDGVTNLDTGSNTGPYFQPSMDAIAEVKVLMTNYQAEYGRNSGGAINVVMRSGSRQLHGSGYYFKRNEAFNANNFFNNAFGRSRERYRYDLFGYTIGGPVYIPKVLERTRDKLFFFWSHEAAPQKVPVPIGFLSVPTEAERRADYSRTLESDGRLIPIRDPLTGQPFPGNIVPANRIDPNGQAILNLMPLPNTSSPTQQFNYVYQSIINRPRDVEILRVDYAASNSTFFYARGILSHEKFEGGIGFVGTSANWPQYPAKYNLVGRGFVLNLTKTFGSAKVNELVFGANRGEQNRGALDDDALQSIQRQRRGLSTLGQLSPQANPYAIIPNATFGGVPNAMNLTVERKFPFVGRNTIWNITDNFTWTHGPHTLKTGIYLEPTSRNARMEANFNGQFSFGRDPNNPLDSNWAWSNTLLGVFSNYTESDNHPFVHGRFRNVEWYLQDTWKVSRRLSLDLGVRFYHIPPNYTSDDNISGFVLDRWDPRRAPALWQPARDGNTRVAENPLTGERLPAVFIGALVQGSGDPFNGLVVASQDTSYPRGLYDDRGIHYSPRIGFSLDPTGSGHTAIRGGFGLFYDRVQTDVALQMAENAPLRNNPVLYYERLSTFAQSRTALFPGDLRGVDRRGKVPNVMNWSLGVQRSIGFATVIDVAYVGSVARNLMWQRNINQIPYGANFAAANQDPTNPGRPLPVNFYRPYPGHASIAYREFAGTSNYHSMQVQANRRFAQGLQFGFAWTWSKNMNYAEGNFTEVAVYAPLRAWNYGKGSFDRTHNVNINYSWDLPRPSTLWNVRMVKSVLDGWQLSGITTFMSGSPMGVSLATTDNADIAGGGDGVRPVMLQNAVLPRGERSLTRYFNTEAFGRPERGTFGNAPKDIFRGPGINNWDISLLKNIPMPFEGHRLQFRTEFYNAFNHTQFSDVDTAARFDMAGRQVNTRFGQLIAARAPRQIQFSLRYVF
jgi:hypothetical protein